MNIPIFKWIRETLINSDLTEEDKINCALVAGINYSQGALKGDISEAWVKLLENKYTRKDLIIKMKDLYL